MVGVLGDGWGGTVRAPLRAFALLAALAAAMLAISTGIARAEPPALISYGSFSTQTKGAIGITVEKSGDLFVSSLFEGNPFAPGHAIKLSPSGVLLSPPSPFGSAHYSGVAVSPSNGDVYALGEESLFSPATIFIYDPNTGSLVSSFEVSTSRNFSGYFTDVQIAVDSAGDVYVPNVPENEVVEYGPTGAELKAFTDSGSLKEPTGVAIDSSGNLWVASPGSNRIVELDSAGAPVEVKGKPVEIESEGVWSVAHDGQGHVFGLASNGADPCGVMSSPCLHLLEYNAEGRQLADVGAGDFGTPETGATTRFYSEIAVNQANGRVYVVDGLKETIWAFGPPAAIVVGRELSDEVSTSEAKLGALINPGGLPTTYRFEYGATSAYGVSTPFPEGTVGEGLEPRAVWASAGGLAPGTTYHYRVVATSELGTVYGPDQTFTTLTAEQAACPNSQVRGGFSGRLPECRAYELVTPPVKSSAQLDAADSISYSSIAAADGEAVTLYAREPLPGAPTAGERYVSTRSPGGWNAEDVMPFEPYDGTSCMEYQHVDAYSDELTGEVMRIDGGTRASDNSSEENPESCNPDGYQVVSGEPVGYENLLVRDNTTGTYQLVNVTPVGVTPADATFEAASADLSHVIFTETSPLAEGAVYGAQNLYEWDDGVVRLVTVLPGGTAVVGSLAAPLGNPAHQSVVSSEGSHVLFTYQGALYDRIDGQHTIQIDETEGGSGTSGGGSFKAASANGATVFFTDESRLTADSTAAAGEPDLYECTLPEGASKCELSDRTVAPSGGHADVQRVIPLGRNDSSYVYFVARGVLAANSRQYTNSEGKNTVESAEAGQENLYLWHGDTTTFIASGIHYSAAGDEQTSPDGMWLAFESEKSLTNYDVVQPSAGFEVRELYLYSAASGQLDCASCNPTGEAPGVGGGVQQTREEEQEYDAVKRHEQRTRRLLTDKGQAFFDTSEALVPSDTNGQLDVYEYHDGHVYLISSGTSSFESNFEDVSESGNDVFFRSNQQLVPQDTQEGMIMIYDARVNGGFPPPTSPPACTTADACRTPVPPQPAVYGAPSSQTFSGPGNAASEATAKTKHKHKKKAKRSRCKRRGRAYARCAAHRRNARAKAKTHRRDK